jgi:sulfate permease, SulP family
MTDNEPEKTAQGLRNTLSSCNTNRFLFRQSLPSISAGLVNGVIVITIELSFAALIFSGPLAGQIARGIGFYLFGAFVICSVAALFSSFGGTIAVPQDSPAAILALVGAAIVAKLQTTPADDRAFSTVIVAIATTTCMTGAVLLAFGFFKLGNLMRFIPYPVVGGFLAGTGLLLVQGALRIMMGPTLNLLHANYLFVPGVLLQWLPGALLAILLLLILRRYSNFIIMPALIILSIGLFYGMLLLTHTSIAVAETRGWLLGPFPQAGLWQPLTFKEIAQVNWPAILGQLDKLGTIAFISAVALLLNTSGLELAIRQDVDLNRELQVAGFANLLAALGGGPVGYQTLSLTSLAHRVGGRGRLVGLTVAAIFAAMLLFGSNLLSYFPKVVLGGLLLFLGFSFLAEWVYDAWFKLPRVDYAVVILILAVIGFAGFLEGVAAGIAIAIILFIASYSRINIVRRVLSGTYLHSAVDRPASQCQLLRDNGGLLGIYQLQGYIFFGTAQSLLSQIHQRITYLSPPFLRFVILDFTRVTGLDSSASSSFVRMNQLAETKDIQLVFIHVPLKMQFQLQHMGLNNKGIMPIQFLPTLDVGLEWCEEQILLEESKILLETPVKLQTELFRLFPNPADVARFLNYLEIVQVESGERFIHQGASPDCYFLESGLASAVLELPDERSIRLRVMHG